MNVINYFISDKGNQIFFLKIKTKFLTDNLIINYLVSQNLQRMQITPIFHMIELYIQQYVELFITIPSNVKNEQTDEQMVPKSNLKT